MILVGIGIFYALGTYLIWSELLCFPTLATTRAIKKFPYKRKVGETHGE